MVQATLKTRPAEILLVDDDLGDVKLTMEAFKAFKIPLKVSRARDGEEAIDFLRKKNGYQSAANPDLIFLDLKLPRKSGFEVLAEIKQDSALKTIPVLVLTSSNSTEDIVAAYEANANFYIVKPTKVDEFWAAMKYVEEYWLAKMNLTLD
jgi:CheY-like chemotaxis protein